MRQGRLAKKQRIESQRHREKRRFESGKKGEEGFEWCKGKDICSVEMEGWNIDL